MRRNRAPPKAGNDRSGESESRASAGHAILGHVQGLTLDTPRWDASEQRRLCDEFSPVARSGGDRGRL